jgi:sulfur carrier protein
MEMIPPATITLNGTPHPLEAAVQLAVLLEQLGLAGRPVVVELDERAVFPRDYAITSVSPGARLEIVTLAAGG